MGIKVIAKNKRASYDFQLLEKFEVGMVLVGTEVKSIRNGKVTIAEAHISIDSKGEVWAHNINIPHYEFGNINNHDERRTRKLLLHNEEIARIAHKSQAERLTIVPTMIYFKGSNVKLEIALAKGKKLHDKRQDEAKKDVERKLRRGQYD
ncbi:SsrA-binding protein SmpB [Halobacteriovorax sp. GB3]|uniref:SsrA-binding protein SmpB n=1 Tax=Halobacteriovorax sp. GB3 TaxID=2719615 RepID=UPI0023627A5B|nr:SsrA-binding protein SmpB [Halobacteriovorax sp. GB3]MDD0851579.1 SsrA-binding protein SmpB [Halobacteriovorax sp. GB3]